MKREKDIHDLIREGPVYLINDYENAVFRTEIDDKHQLRVFCKIKGKPEFETSLSSGIFKDVYTTHYMISKEEYEKY